MADEMKDLVFDDCREKMRKAVRHLQDEFGGIRTGRATPGLVEKLKVDYYGVETPLQQLAGFSVPEPRLLVISPYDKTSSSRTWSTTTSCPRTSSIGRRRTWRSSPTTSSTRSTSCSSTRKRSCSTS